MAFLKRSVALIILVLTSILFSPHQAIESSSSLNAFHSTVSGKDGTKPVAIIIGAGPVGLATALALSPCCETIYLVEKSTSFGRQGATFGLAVNGQKCLAELDTELYEHVRDLALIDPSSIGNSWLFLWSDLRDALVDAVRRRNCQGGNIRFCMGRECVGAEEIIQDHGKNGGGHNGMSVMARFRNGLPLRADFLVGADGVNSRIRQALQLPALIASNTTNFRGNLHVPSVGASPDLEALLENPKIVPLRVELGKNLYFLVFNFHRRHPRRLAWILASNSETDGPITAQQVLRSHVTEPETLRLLEEIVNLSDSSSWKPYPRSSIVDFSDNAQAQLEGEGRSLWGGRGSITVVGDAAHAMRPIDGFGGSLGLEDAVVMARTMTSRPLSSKQDISDLLRQFEQERLPRVKRVYDNQYERYEMRMTQGQQPGSNPREFVEWLEAGV